MSVNGRQRYSQITLQPNKLYETDDALLIKTLSEQKMTRNYTLELENLLKETKTPYKLQTKKCCGGRMTKKLEYMVVNVYA